MYGVFVLLLLWLFLFHFVTTQAYLSWPGLPKRRDHVSQWDLPGLMKDKLKYSKIKLN